MAKTVLVQRELESRLTRPTHTWSSEACVFEGIGECSEWDERVGRRIAISVPREHSSHTPPAEAGTPNPELARPRTAQSFCVPKADLAAQGYDLSLNRYKEVDHAEIAHRPPGEILKSLAALEKEITTGMKELEDMLR